MTGTSKKRLLLSTVLLLLMVGVLRVVAESFGDSESFFGDVEGIGELCDGEKCQMKVVKTTEEPAQSDVVAESSESEAGPQGKRDESKPEKSTDEEINVMITFTNAVGKTKFHQKFELTVSSLLKHATKPLALHILGDPESQEIAKKIIKKAKAKSAYRIVGLDVKDIAVKIDEIIRPMQHHFSYKPGAYYSDALFFLSIGMHRVMPDHVHKVIMLDADLKFTDDIAKLYDRFRLFRKDNILGIGYDLQPVYRHQFWKYRNENPGTRVGEPGPKGLQGFNSGVLLLDLDKMRHSKLYNSLINADAVQKLTEEYSFKGHLGDQDFFTLVGMKYEWLFHVLPCQWNRQLCRWWEDKGYKDIFPQYFDCEDPIKIWHGNCNTPIPE